MPKHPLVIQEVDGHRLTPGLKFDLHRAFLDTEQPLRLASILKYCLTFSQ